MTAHFLHRAAVVPAPVPATAPAPAVSGARMGGHDYPEPVVTRSRADNLIRAGWMATVVLGSVVFWGWIIGGVL